jgi:molybdate transport system substrate-binding protein
MDLAVGADLIARTPVAFATSSLAVIASGDAVQALEDLAAPGVSVVLAHPSVPAGAYARQMLENLSADADRFGGDYSLRVLENVVSEETNVRNVEQKVALGEVDVGIVYRPGAEKVAASGVSDGQGVRLVPVPVDYNVHAAYPIAVLRDSGRPDLAAEFVAFVLSPQGQEIMRKHGFEP